MAKATASDGTWIRRGGGCPDRAAALPHRCAAALLLVASAISIAGSARAADPRDVRSAHDGRSRAAAPEVSRTASAAAAGSQPSSGAASATSPDETAFVPIDPPMAVRVQLLDGVTLAGVISSWSRLGGVVGNFGYRRWNELRPTDAQTLFIRLMDRSQASEWVALGRMLLMHPSGGGLAESAFRRARLLDPNIEPSIEATQREVADRARAGRDAAVDRLRADDPEGRQWPPTPWPRLSDAELVQAATLLRADARTMLTLAGIEPMAPVESERLMVFGSLPRVEQARLAVAVERALDQLIGALGARSAPPQPWGKIVVFLVDDRAAFARLQQRVFFQLDRPDVTAMAHSVGPRTAIVALVGPGGDDLLVRVAGQAAHALMHRYISPVRLPPWANMGLALWTAAKAAPRFPELAARRAAALAFVRGGGDVARILESGYADPGWPGPPLDGATLGRSGVGPSVGRLFVELMLKDRPDGFADWVIAVKNGTPWPEALTAKFGVTPPRFLATALRWFRTND
ncbi:MAG TPA: hypothetical protein PKC43_04570 [Phycisphaerales bacterium]|nr:hypothetical protein [Phycisphaerales bacterium]HMP36701.1 hypothetical protein [Phycisphaerales bacterium]